MSARRLLILSPHSDDTAFSLGGLLAEGSAFQGWRKHQLTLFVRSCHAPYAPWLDGVEAITTARSREDDAFCACHDISLRRLDLDETLVRGYPSVASIFAPRQPHEDALFARTCREVEQAVTSFDMVLAPLGIGGHIEHVLVREACRRVRPDALYYEDLPYAGDFSNAELDDFVLAFDPDARWRCFGIGSALGEKSACLLGYASQVAETDLHKVISYSWRRRPAEALAWHHIKEKRCASPSPMEVLWGSPSALEMMDLWESEHEPR